MLVRGHVHFRSANGGEVNTYVCIWNPSPHPLEMREKPTIRAIRLAFELFLVVFDSRISSAMSSRSKPSFPVAS